MKSFSRSACCFSLAP